MFQEIRRKLSTTIMGGAIIIGTAQVLSRLLGLLRERLLASTFGAGNTLDVYYAAFKIPDFVFNIIVLGALSSAFVPVFLEYWNKSKEESFKIANSLLNIILLALLAIGIVVFFFTDLLVPLVAVGFNEEKREMTAQLVKIMYLGILFFGVSNIVSGILHSFRRFIAFSLAPIMYNLGIIFGIIALVPRFGTSGLAYGVVAGAFLHLVVQIPSVVKAGFRYRILVDWSLAGVKKIGKLMLPRALGLGVTQINQVVITAIASTLAVGSVAVFNLANNLQYFPISVFGVSLALSAFPVFSQAFTEKNKEKFILHFSQTFRRILFLIIPASLIILLLRAQIVRLVLGAGNFNWEDTILTAQTLGFFSLSLFAQSLIPVLARAFYAFQNTKTPVIISVISMIANVIGSLIFVHFWGVYGLALAFSLASFVNMILLLIMLRIEIGELDDQRIINSTLKIIFLSLLMGLVIQGLKYLIAPQVNMQTFVGVFSQTAGSILGGLTVYLLLAALFRFEEVATMVRMLKKAKNQLWNKAG
ncbi:MAG: murein biosynthesis integral membrane protein MurJ [Candidatus Kerfeldbacteria bacterium CG08_land_8_20_14_0_20_40_16]|uniref:Probable lipid II flippase MurJ n=1 Tax=Candidatus Kerfeldbacteria bacterium CG08_land_8_20_14_0_20_40_16 TaxID=2014244 RepID=A0A2H0YX28_9BACT|nr:MAG: murein biosynthesis integral membrane protein MurJ [Candidatus Kerfeldbacteria bacterium CG08_land_8_20_14_0_20_40_16]